MKKELSKNWVYLTFTLFAWQAKLRCGNLEKWGFETFVLKHKTVTSPLRFYIYVRKDLQQDKM